jgi:hypothetical protein
MILTRCEAEHNGMRFNDRAMLTAYVMATIDSTLEGGGEDEERGCDENRPLRMFAQTPGSRRTCL